MFQIQTDPSLFLLLSPTVLRKCEYESSSSEEYLSAAFQMLDLFRDKQQHTAYVARMHIWISFTPHIIYCM